jgi:hypothetical protein
MVDVGAPPETAAGGGVNGPACRVTATPMAKAVANPVAKPKIALVLICIGCFLHAPLVTHRSKKASTLYEIDVKQLAFLAQ